MTLPLICYILDLSVLMTIVNIKRHVQRTSLEIGRADSQRFGFIKFYSTTQLFLRFMESMTEAGRQGKQTTAFFSDVAKAFNHVWHEGILYKRKDVLLSDSYFRFIYSFLQDRTFQV